MNVYEYNEDISDEDFAAETEACNEFISEAVYPILDKVEEKFPNAGGYFSVLNALTHTLFDQGYQLSAFLISLAEQREIWEAKVREEGGEDAEQRCKGTGVTNIDALRAAGGDWDKLKPEDLRYSNITPAKLYELVKNMHVEPAFDSL